MCEIGDIYTPYHSGSQRRSSCIRPRLPTVFLLCGIPGSGKTTLAKFLKNDIHDAHIVNEHGWVGSTAPRELPFAPKEMDYVLRDLKILLQQGVPCVVDHINNTKHSHRRAIIELAKQINCNIVIVMLETLLETAVERCKRSKYYRNLAAESHTSLESILAIHQQALEPPTMEEIDGGGILAKARETLRFCCIPESASQYIVSYTGKRDLASFLTDVSGA